MNAQIVAPLAWTLAHFLWQGALIALLAAMLKNAAGNSVEWRYRISVGAMALMVLAPLVTFALYFLPDAPSAGGDGAPGGLMMILGGSGSSIAAGASIPWKLWIVSAWAAGVVVLSLRLIIGWNVAQNLVRGATLAVPENARALFDRLIARMPMRRAVRLAVSDRIPTAMVIGWLRPVILLPLAAATGLTFAQLEAILAHELAHIRRHDFAVNVLQCCAECLLFYHPAVWWLSSEIRREREHCCDDLAIAICGDRVVYATALVELESARAKPMLAMAASGSDLARRVRRIFGEDSAGAGWKDAALAAVLVVALLAGSAFYGMRAEAQQATPAPAAPVNSEQFIDGRVGAPQATPPVRIIGDASGGLPRPRDPNAWALFDGSHIMSHTPDNIQNGKNVDVETAFAAHRALNNINMIWFRIDGRTGVIEDTAIMARIDKLLPPPMNEAHMNPQQRAAMQALKAMPNPIRINQMNPQDRAKVEKLIRTVEGGHSPADVNPQVLAILRDAIAHGLAKSAP